MARAVHYAHQRGILHRDLKPANILLSGRSSDSPLGELVPLVTDFGLAKRFEGSGAALTQSGSIVGTPSYMAPEQAEGRRESVTTAVDVHALGAILFELSDRPAAVPRRDDARDAAPGARARSRSSQRDQSQGRSRPGDDRAQVPGEAPARRYHSAEALAEDLERWLADLPIRARPATLAHRLVKWVRRRPAAAGLILAAVVAALATAAAIRGYLSAAELRGALRPNAGWSFKPSEKSASAQKSGKQRVEEENYAGRILAVERLLANANPVQDDPAASPPCSKSAHRGFAAGSGGI